MPTYRYQLNVPTNTTLQRLKEIQFYLFLESFFYKYNHDNQYIIDLVESLALLFDCKPTIITILIDHFKSPVYKPDKMEQVVGAFYLGIPVRKLSKIVGMGVETYYKYLNKYIQEGQQQLEPRLTSTYTDELDKFISNAEVMFKEVSNSLRGTDIYDVNNI